MPCAAITASTAALQATTLNMKSRREVPRRTPFRYSDTQTPTVKVPCSVGCTVSCPEAGSMAIGGTLLIGSVAE